MDRIGVAVGETFHSVCGLKCVVVAWPARKLSERGSQLVSFLVVVLPSLSFDVGTKLFAGYDARAVACWNGKIEAPRVWFSLLQGKVRALSKKNNRGIA